MKKFLLFIIVISCFAVNTKAQYSTIDSAYVVQGVSNFWVNQYYSSPVPSGPDYGCMLYRKGKLAETVCLQSEDIDIKNFY